MALQPILESAVALILTMLEVVKGKYGLKITEYNQNIQDLANLEEKVNTIGFVYEQEEEETNEEIL